MLQAKGIVLSRSTILRCRRGLGWTYRGSAYCQLIREANKAKCLAWCIEHQNNTFRNVLWTDETTVQLENHRRFCNRKKDRNHDQSLGTCAYQYAQYSHASPYVNFFFTFFYRPKHPAKVHVWAGISCFGATRIWTFQGIMNAEGYVSVLETGLLPSVGPLFRGRKHLFMQDNDPKHTSRRAREFFDAKGIEWWKTPAESPDLNPIENLWHELHSPHSEANH